MYLIDNGTAAAALPASTAAGTAGYFTDGNAGTGVSPTVVPAEFLNMTMMELANVVTGAGLALSKSSFNQAYQAIRRLSQKSVVLTDTGTVNTYAAVNTPALATGDLVSGLVQRVSIATLNTGASAYTPDALASKPIYGMALTALQGGELPAKGIATLMYLVASNVNSGNGAWILLECTGGALPVANATASQHAATLGQVQSGTAYTAVATGTSDALVAAFTPAITAVANQTILVRAGLANTTTTPKINPGSGAITIVKGAGIPLAVGDISGAGHWLELTLDATLGQAVLLNPATGVAVQAPQLMPLTASVASSLITASLAAVPLEYRNATLTTGSGTTLSQAALTIAMPSIAVSLGATSGVATQIAVLSAYNAGSPVLCFANMSGGLDLSETGLISPTTISASATSASVIYSASAVAANTTYRIVGYLNATWTSGTGWTLSQVQPYGGQAMAAMQSFGFGQTYQAVTRTLGTTYYNTTGKPITLFLATGVNNTSATGFIVTVNGVQVANTQGNASAIGMSQNVSASIPISAGASYVITGVAPTVVAELR